jgi:hypothetical protein
MTAAAPAAELLDWLFRHGFRPDNRCADAARTDKVRVVIDDEEGFFTLIRFDDRYPQAESEAWSVRFANAPLPVITAAITTAMEAGS